MRRRIDLNVDIGEGFAFDRDLLEFATSANVCCGVHAGSLDLTRQTIELCRRKRVRIGVHPGYPDRVNMGRRSMELGEQTSFLNSVREQIRRFLDFDEAAYLKPHGAFYNDTAQVLPEGWSQSEERPEYDEGGHYLSRTMPGASTLAMLLRVHKLPLMGLPGTAHEEIARRAKVPLIREGFADRRYREDGTLVPRSQPGALIEDPAEVAEQVARLAERVDSICLHGDGDHCLEFAESVVRTLLDSGFEVRA